MNNHFEVLSILANNLTAVRFTTDNTGQVSLTVIEIFGNTYVFTLSKIGIDMCFRVVLDEVDNHPIESITSLPNESNRDYASRILELIKDYK